MSGILPSFSHITMIGIGGYAASATPGVEIKTMALGSCVGVTFWEPTLRIAGMIHVAYPYGTPDNPRVLRLPGYFANTGLPLIFKRLRLLGGNPRNLIIKMMGGARMLDPNNTFAIGQKNAASIKSILTEMGLRWQAEELGGEISRTVAIEVDTGTVTIQTPEMPVRYL